MKRLLIIGSLAVCLTSCFKNNLVPTYHGVNNIYFSTATVEQQYYLPRGFGADSAAVSFGLLPDVKDSLVSIPVKIMGMPAKVDRQYKVKILDSSTAEEGVDFSIPKNEDFTIQAGQRTDTLEVILYNTPNLRMTLFL